MLRQNPRKITRICCVISYSPSLYGRKFRCIFFADDDWRSQKLFGVSIKLWQLSKKGDEISIVVPETAYAQPFLRSVMESLRKDLDLPEKMLQSISSSSKTLAKLLVKEEAEEDDAAVDGGEAVGNEALLSEKEPGSKRGSNRKDSNANYCVAEDCGQRFNSHRTLVTHFKQRHPKLYCSKCRSHFSTKRSRRDHLCLKPFPCNECSRRFSSKQERDDHNLIHTKDRPHSCPVCDKTFRQKSTLRRHRLQHEEKRYVCSVCEKAFALRQYLVRHERLHSGEKPFQCHKCGQKFSQSENLSKHVRLIHQRETNFVCEDCGEGFVQEYYLKRHRAVSHKENREMIEVSE